MKQVLILCVSACLLLGASCKKEDDGMTMRTEMITAHPWRLSTLEARTQIGSNDHSPTFSDLYDLMLICQRDNEFTFNTDYTITVDEGEKKCDPDGSQSYPLPDGKWGFKTADTQLELTDTTGTVLWEIISFNENELMIQHEVVEEDTHTTTTAKYIPVH